MRLVQVITLPIALASAAISGYSITVLIGAEARYDAEFIKISDQISRLKTELKHAAVESESLTARQSLPTSDSELSAETGAIIALREEVAWLREEQTRYQKAFSDQMSNDDQNKSEIRVLQSEDIEQNIAALETQAVEIEQGFEFESVDPAWGSWAELEIQTEITNGALEGAHVMSTECRNTVCRVEVEFDDAMTKLKGMQTLSMLMPWPGESYMRHDQTTDGNSVVLYVAREGQSVFAETQ